MVFSTGISELERLDDEELQLLYEEATDLSLDREFIELLRSILVKREILN